MSTTAKMAKYRKQMAALEAHKAEMAKPEDQRDKSKLLRPRDIIKMRKADRMLRVLSRKLYLCFKAALSRQYSDQSRRSSRHSIDDLASTPLSTNPKACPVPVLVLDCRGVVVTPAMRFAYHRSELARKTAVDVRRRLRPSKTLHLLESAQPYRG